MKNEYQSMIDSVTEALPLNGVTFQKDPLHYKFMNVSTQIKFIETQWGN